MYAYYTTVYRQLTTWTKDCVYLACTFSTKFFNSLGIIFNDR